MKTLNCTQSENCPIYNNSLLKNKETEEAYKNIYCRNGEDRFTTCKRYLVTEELGRCADFVMPNSFLSVNSIIEKIKEEEEKVLS